jgi:undecaprenyl-diphosphatase
MPILFAMLLGLIQGLSEFLPISSSAHLALADACMGGRLPISDALAFDVLLHLGTLFAVLICYRSDVLSMLLGAKDLIVRLFCKNKRKAPLGAGERSVLLLAVATAPMALALAVSPLVERMVQTPKWIGGALIVNACLLFLSDRCSRGHTDLSSLTFARAALIGCSQLLAVVPGISRSGMTSTAGVLLGLGRKDAVRFSFLLSLPTVLGAGLLKLPALFAQGMDGEIGAVCLVGGTSAMLLGVVAIRLLDRMAKSKRFAPFAYYCLILGALALMLG